MSVTCLHQESVQILKEGFRLGYYSLFLPAIFTLHRIVFVRTCRCTTHRLYSYFINISLTDNKYKAVKMKILKINEYRLKDVKT